MINQAHKPNILILGAILTRAPSIATSSFPRNITTQNKLSSFSVTCASLLFTSMRRSPSSQKILRSQLLQINRKPATAIWVRVHAMLPVEPIHHPGLGFLTLASVPEDNIKYLTYRKSSLFNQIGPMEKNRPRLILSGFIL